MEKSKYSPSMEDFKKKAREHNIVPVYRDILADTDTPVSAFMKIDAGDDAFLLESVEGGEKWGRYSFLGTKPRMTVRSKGIEVEITEGEARRTEKGNPIEILKGIMSGFTPADVEGAPRFFGGAIGYMSYDIVRHIERLPDIAKKDLDIHDMFFIFTDTLLVFDNVEHKIKVISNAYIEEGADTEEVYNGSIKKIDAIIKSLKKNVPALKKPAPACPSIETFEGRLKRGLKRGAKPPSGKEGITSNFARNDFLGAVSRIKEYITNGDIIQAVVSQRFSTALDVSPLDIYRALRVINPSPYMFFLRLGNLTLAGSSPEILVRVDGKDVNVKPIAGTRRRGRDEEEDRALEKELLLDPKERAEHIMLVDLGRNDLGRVSEPGTIEVDSLMAVERYSHVMHIVSNIKGRLNDGLDSFEALKACFPAGTLTGAPKIRAMEIIEELEPVKRGVYGGSVGYFGYSGNMDMCITIRTLVIKDGRVYIQAGAGIVADSAPEKEFEETESKAGAMLKAMDMARDGLF